MKYGKTILARHEVNYNYKDIEVLVLDDKDYFNIHIIDDDYSDEELNTLKLQEPKDRVTLEEVTDKMFLECQGLQHLLWDKFYGYKNKSYNFNVEACDTYEL